MAIDTICFESAAPRAEDLERLEVPTFVPSLPRFIRRSCERYSMTVSVSKETDLFMIDTVGWWSNCDAKLKDAKSYQRRQSLSVSTDVNIR